MLNESANVSVKIQPEIKQMAEARLAELGVPVSVLIDTLYRQIIITGHIPYRIDIPEISTLDGMSADDFDKMMQQGFDDVVNGKGLPVDEAFEKIKEAI